MTGEGYQAYIDDSQTTPTISTATTPDVTGLSADLMGMLQDPKATPAFNQSIPGFGSFGKNAVSVVIGHATPQEAADRWNVFVEQAIEAQRP